MRCFEQILKYARCIQLIFNDYREKFPKKVFRLYIQMYLIGRSIDKSGNFCYLPNLFGNINILTYSIDLEDGVVFKDERDYSLTEGSYPNTIPFNKKMLHLLC